MNSHEIFDEMYELFVEEISHIIQSIYASKFMKELETNFGDFLHNLFEEIIIWHLWYINDIYSFVHYIIFIFMVH